MSLLKNKHKIDDLDFGLQSADRNIECYQKAKDKYGNNLTGVEIISNNENSGCYAHTSDKIFKANALKNHICHISEKHYVSQYCDPVSVDKGDKLASLEAMKMQHEILAPVPGKIVQLEAHENSQVSAKDLLLEIEPALDSDT